MARIDLTGRPIAITGGNSGIGAAIALACARAGMPLALGARRADRLDRVASMARDLGVPVFTRALDVRDAAACREFIRLAWGELGPLYAVCANAGYGLERPVHETDDAALRDIFETNFFGSMHVLRPAIDLMLGGPAERPGPRGHLLMVSSCLAKMTVPLYGAYSATKAAQNHIGRAMRLELAPLGIRVSTIHPITTRTDFFDTVKQQSDKRDIVAHAPAWFSQDASVVADRTVACLRRDRPEVWTGFKGAFVRFGMCVNTLLPRLADWTTRGMVNAPAARGSATADPAPAAPPQPDNA